MTIHPIIKDNAQSHRYEMEVNGQVVFATYRRHDGIIHILHVEAPPSLRGSGAAGRFMHELMEHLREQKLKAMPICSYAVAWLQRHKEFQDMTVRS